LIRTDGTMLLVKGVFERNVEHPDLGSIQKGTISYEYYWLDRWFNVFRFHEPDGDLRNYYCNVNLPPTFENAELNYVDLDLDILVDTEWNIKVLDLAEFYRNADRFLYGDHISSKALKQIENLRQLIELRQFPFDWTPQPIL